LLGHFHLPLADGKTRQPRTGPIWGSPDPDVGGVAAESVVGVG
jgi:hypothetical protein